MPTTIEINPTYSEPEQIAPPIAVLGGEHVLSEEERQVLRHKNLLSIVKDHRDSPNVIAAVTEVIGEYRGFLPAENTKNLELKVIDTHFASMNQGLDKYTNNPASVSEEELQEIAAAYEIIYHNTLTAIKNGIRARYSSKLSVDPDDFFQHICEKDLSKLIVNFKKMDKAGFQGFIARIVHNAIIDAARRDNTKNKYVVPLDRDHNDDTEPADPADPTIAIEDNEYYKKLAGRLLADANLSPERLAVVGLSNRLPLTTIEDFEVPLKGGQVAMYSDLLKRLPQDEDGDYALIIARILKVSSGTVKSRLHRAKVDLREYAVKQSLSLTPHLD